VVLIEEAAEAVHLGEVVATLGATARLANFALLLGGHTVRHEASVELAGENAHCGYDGAFVVSGRDEANIVTTIDHAAPGGQTRELVKGVGAGRGHGAFQGRIIVRPDAQKTDAHQLSRSLIIGDRAVIDTKPELEIHADDVKCSHGASVGDLDETALFYLRARGIPEDEARRLLVDGFLREAVETVEHPGLREHLLRRLAHRLESLEASV
jgi:Fe-S cluster assembly protein SufD